MTAMLSRYFIGATSIVGVDPSSRGVDHTIKPRPSGFIIVVVEGIVAAERAAALHFQVTPAWQL